MAEVVKHKQKSEIGCVGDICYNKQTKKLRIDLDAEKCSPEALADLREALTYKSDETEVEWVIPAKTKRVTTTTKETD